MNSTNASQRPEVRGTTDAGVAEWGDTSWAAFAAVSESGDASLAGFAGSRRPQTPGGLTAIPAAFRYAPAVSRRTPVSFSIRRNGQPSRPSAIPCGRFVVAQDIGHGEEDSCPDLSVGRFWASPEVCDRHRRNTHLTSWNRLSEFWRRRTCSPLLVVSYTQFGDTPRGSDAF
jgi:hypothetical protein